jgi:Fe-S-cluster containining protein
MVAGRKPDIRLLREVAKVYDWLDSQIQKNSALAGVCDACGKCCDFKRFDHQLFVTTPEMMYLAANLGGVLTAETAESAEKNKNKIKRSDNTKNLGVLCELSGKRKMSRCPYNIKGKCTVYKFRFAGCRIFCCKGDADFQSRLSETALKKFKAICEQFQIPYRYLDLPTALVSIDRITGLSC